MLGVHLYVPSQPRPSHARFPSRCWGVPSSSPLLFHWSWCPTIPPDFFPLVRRATPWGVGSSPVSWVESDRTQKAIGIAPPLWVFRKAFLPRKGHCRSHCVGCDGTACSLCRPPPLAYYRFPLTYVPRSCPCQLRRRCLVESIPVSCTLAPRLISAVTVTGSVLRHCCSTISVACPRTSPPLPLCPHLSSSASIALPCHLSPSPAVLHRFQSSVCAPNQRLVVSSGGRATGTASVAQTPVCVVLPV